MKALFLVQGMEVAASRYRALQFFPGLSKRGIECRVRRFPSFVELAGVFAQTRREDALFLQRKQLGPIPLSILRLAARRLVYDFDDSLWVRSAKHPDNRSFTRRTRFKRMVSRADEVIAGNSFLAERASVFNQRVTVIPSPIDISRYPLRPPASDSRSVTLGWIGAPGSLHYLERLKPALAEAHRRDPRIRLKIICSTFPDFSPVPVDRIPWREDTEVEELRSMDIGLMPLLEDDWSRGKCGLKILQYLAAGVTVVATPVGINADIVSDGVEGFRARTQDEWVDRLLLLASDPALRREMGLAGRKTVESRYSLEGCLPLMEKVLRG